MAFDIYSPAYMEAAIKEIKPLYTFIKDRYFTEQRVFKTEKVFVDYDDGAGAIVAPFVMPKIGTKPLIREGYSTYELVPPYVGVSYPLDVETLKTRLAGESIVSEITPEQREKYYLVSDLAELDRAITRREEKMCADLMLDNELTMKHEGAENDKGESLTVKYYDGTDNPGVFKPSKTWAVGTKDAPGTWYDDICDQIDSMTAAGREVTDMLIGSDVANMVLRDPFCKDMFVTYRNGPGMGEFDVRWQPNGVTQIGRINFRGVQLNLFSYIGTYEERTVIKKAAPTKKRQPYLPSTAVILAAPGTGIMRYGAVNQMEDDKQFHTRTGARVPKYAADVHGDTKETMLKSRPLPAPKMKGQWRGCRDALATV